VSAALGPPAVSDRGVALDGQIHLLLGLTQSLPGMSMEGTDPKKMRQETRFNSVLVAPRCPGGLSVKDASVAGLPARIYRPDTAVAPGDQDGAAIVYFHGGGFVVGDLDSHDGSCRLLAHRSRCTVISVEYRLAPEHPFPAAPEDARKAFLDVVARADALSLDPKRIAIGGDSAGGNLAAVASIMLRDAGGPMPAFQLLIYPGTDMTRGLPSQQIFASGFYLEGPTIDWFVAQYCPKEHVRDWRASPLFVEDCSNLPPAYVVVAGFDPLRDEGEAYARRLQEAGVPTESVEEPGLIHGFFSMAGISTTSRTATLRLADALNRALRPSNPS
jgi:acetyl esterase